MKDVAFETFKQTNKLYDEIKRYYGKKFDASTPFPVVTIHINLCVKRFKRKPRYKVLFLTMRYLDEIGYPKGYVSERPMEADLKSAT